MRFRVLGIQAFGVFGCSGQSSGFQAFRVYGLGLGV